MPGSLHEIGSRHLLIPGPLPNPPSIGGQGRGGPGISKCPTDAYPPSIGGRDAIYRALIIPRSRVPPSIGGRGHNLGIGSTYWPDIQ